MQCSFVYLCLVCVHNWEDDYPWIDGFIGQSDMGSWWLFQCVYVSICLCKCSNCTFIDWFKGGMQGWDSVLSKSKGQREARRELLFLTFSFYLHFECGLFSQIKQHTDLLLLSKFLECFLLFHFDCSDHVFHYFEHLIKQHRLCTSCIGWFDHQKIRKPKCSTLIHPQYTVHN